MSRKPTISFDGRYIAFSSIASNLVEGITDHYERVYVLDRKTGRNALVSVGSEGIKVDGNSNLAFISANGRHVVFVSEASTLVNWTTKGSSTVYVHDLSDWRLFPIVEALRLRRASDAGLAYPPPTSSSSTYPFP